MWIICFSPSLLELGGKLSVEEAVKRSFSAVNGDENTQRKKKCNKTIGFLFLLYNCQSRTKFLLFYLIEINNSFRFFCLQIFYLLCGLQLIPKSIVTKTGKIQSLLYASQILEFSTTKCIGVKYNQYSVVVSMHCIRKFVWYNVTWTYFSCKNSSL